MLNVNFYVRLVEMSKNLINLSEMIMVGGI